MNAFSLTHLDDGTARAELASGGEARSMVVDLSAEMPDTALSALLDAFDALWGELA